MRKDVLPEEYRLIRDHDLLVTLCTKLDGLEKSFDNHLHINKG